MKFALIALISAVAAEEPKKEVSADDYVKKKIGETCDDTKDKMGCEDGARCGWQSITTDGGTPVTTPKVCVKTDQCGKTDTADKVVTKEVCYATNLAATITAAALAISYTF